MFYPLPLYIGLRYTRAKRSNHLISFISLTSMIGIALGVTVLITVLSVMNGFDEQLHRRFFSLAAQVTVMKSQGGLHDWQKLRERLLKEPEVLGVAPLIGGQAMLTFEGRNQYTVITGILPEEEPSISAIADKMVVGKLDQLKSGEFGVVLGEGLALRLGVVIGDKVMMVIPNATVSLAGIQPRIKFFKVIGLFKVGAGFGFDDHLALIHLQDAQALFMLPNQVSGLRLKVNDVYRAPLIASRLQKQLSEGYRVEDWSQENGAFFHAVKMEKTMMFTILCLIVAVAAFNMVASLVMVVNDKRSEIAILRTLGALPRTILSIFVIQGFIVGLVGTLLGVIGGIILASNATDFVNWLQATFHVELLASDVYFVDYLPSKLEWLDILHICSFALGLSFVATLYPAWKASSIQPAEALRYD